jgi:hypothetical protein
MVFGFLLVMAWSPLASARDYSHPPPGGVVLPTKVLRAAQLLDRMGFGESNPNDDVAGRLWRDWGRPRTTVLGVRTWEAPSINWGDVGDPETSPGPAGKNEILIPRAWDNMQEPSLPWASIPPATQASITDQSVNMALSILHEYVHMDQAQPEGYPRFEDPAWQKTLRANTAWMRNTVDSAQAELREADSAKKLADLESLSMLFGALRQNYEARLNDAKLRVKDGDISDGQPWPVLGGSDRKDLNEAIDATNASAKTFLDFLNAEIGKLKVRLQPKPDEGECAGGGTGRSGDTTTRADNTTITVFRDPQQRPIGWISRDAAGVPTTGTDIFWGPDNRTSRVIAYQCSNGKKQILSDQGG